MLQDNPTLYAQKTNPPWWRRKRAAEIQREIADERLQAVLRRDQRVWDLLTEARDQRFHPMYDRDATYAALKAEAQRLVGMFAGEEAAKAGLGTREAYTAVIAALGELLPPDVHDLVSHGDLSEEEAKELQQPYLPTEE